MLNLELHNKLLEIAKEVSRLAVEHPEISPHLVNLEHLLTTSPEEAPVHRPISFLYRKSETNAS